MKEYEILFDTFGLFSCSIAFFRNISKFRIFLELGQILSYFLVLFCRILSHSLGFYRILLNYFQTLLDSLEFLRIRPNYFEFSWFVFVFFWSLGLSILIPQDFLESFENLVAFFRIISDFFRFDMHF